MAVSPRRYRVKRVVDGLLLLGGMGLSACSSGPQPPPVSTETRVPSYVMTLNCSPQQGWQAGVRDDRRAGGCMQESSGEFRQAYRLGQELHAIDRQLREKALTGAERSRLLQERETLINIARMRGWNGEPQGPEEKPVQ